VTKKRKKKKEKRNEVEVEVGGLKGQRGKRKNGKEPGV
jgi:hypothetical protein